MREKIQSLEQSQGAQRLDKEKSWKRMEHRLVKRRASSLGWWKAAAMILILLSLTYGIYYYEHSQKDLLYDKSSSKSLAEIPEIQAPKEIERHKKNTVEEEQTGNISSRVEETKKKEKRPKVATAKETAKKKKSNTLTATTILKVKTLSDTDNEGLTSSIEHKDSLKKEAPRKRKQTIVYYHEIIDTQNEKAAKEQTPLKISIPLFRKENHHEMFASTQKPFIQHLKIKIPKNK